MKLRIAFVSGLISAVAMVAGANADERYFTYSYEAGVLPEGDLEFEQSITNQNGKEDGDYSEWNFRTELEYGVTENYQTALYFNWDSIRSEGVTGQENQNEAKFKNISWENIYQVLNPNLDPVGLALYGEWGTDGIDHELEWKLLLSKPFGKFELVTNAVYEMEWEREDSQTEREATLEFTLGAAYHLTPKLSLGLEARNKSAYPDGLDLNGQEYQTWSVGPNIHYGTPKWWATLTVLPQVWGNGDGSSGSRQLVHEESVEVRLLVGIPL